jgi:hypothetical protein
MSWILTLIAILSMKKSFVKASSGNFSKPKGGCFSVKKLKNQREYAGI